MKKVFALLLVTAMLCSMLPVSALAVGTVEATDAVTQETAEAPVQSGHSHCICGGNLDAHALSEHNKADGSCQSVSFIALNEGNVDTYWESSANRTGYKVPKGGAGTYAFYLTGNLDVSFGFEAPKGYNITICLNGFKITRADANNLRAIGGTLNICDCTGAGTIAGGGKGTTGALQITGEGVCNLYGGTLTTVETTAGWFAGVVYLGYDGLDAYGTVAASGRMNIYGGTVDGSHTKTVSTETQVGRGGSIWVFGKKNVCGSYLNIHGGTVTGGTCEPITKTDGTVVSAQGGNIYVDAYSFLNITGGTISNGSARSGGNIYMAGTLTMTGGTVTGATAGMGVYLYKTATATFGGTAVIHDNADGNLLLASGSAAVTVQDDFTGSIGISRSVLTDGAIAENVTDEAASHLYPNGGGKAIVNTSGTLTYEDSTDHASHCVCGSATVADHTCTAAAWQALDFTTMAETSAKSTSRYHLTGEDVYIYLTGDTAWPKTVDLYDGQKVHLCLNGYKITSSARLFSVYDTCTLEVCDCRGCGQMRVSATGAGLFTSTSATSAAVNYYGGRFTANGSTQYYGPAALSGNTVFNMYGGSITNACSAGLVKQSSGSNGSGSVVFAYNANNTINIYGGKLTGCDAVAEGGVVDMTSSAGNTLNIYGGELFGSTVGTNGGVICSNGTTSVINISGGILHGGSAAKAGAIYTKGAFNMTGGVIIGGTATGSSVAGGNVRIDGTATSTMSGGMILNGTVTQSNSGGGNLSAGTGTTFLLSGGVIAGGECGECGGNLGMYGTFTMTGGLVCGGTAAMAGGNISLYQNNDTLKCVYNAQGGKVAGGEAPNGGAIRVGKNVELNLAGTEFSGGTGTENIYFSSPSTAAVTVSGGKVEATEDGCGINLGETMNLTVDADAISEDDVFHVGISGSRVFAENVTKDVSANFVSDDTAITVKYADNLLKSAMDPQAVGAKAWGGETTLSLHYDDYIYFPDCTDIAVTNGTITSHQAWGTEEDTAIMTERDGVYVATACGTGTITLKDNNGAPVTVNVTVEAAPISLFTIVGHSLGGGSDGNGEQSVVSPAGQAYSTYEANYQNSAFGAEITFIDDVTGYGLGYGAAKRFSSLEAFTAFGSGTRGVGSAVAYKWNQLTGDKVWVLNAAYGGSQLDQWRSRTSTYRDEYAHFLSVYTKVMQVLDAEVTAGHYTLNHNSFLYHNGANGDEFWSDEEYMTAFNDEFLAHLREDTVYTVGGKETKVECIGLTPSYGLHTQSRLNTAQAVSAYTSVSEDYPDIITAARDCAYWTLAENVKNYFAGKTVDYTTHNGETLALPTTGSEVFNDYIHFNQVCYNATGEEQAQSLYNYYNKVDATSVEIVDQNGVNDIGNRVMMTKGNTMRFAAFVRPSGSDNVTYTVTGNAVNVDEKGVFTAVEAGTATVTVKAVRTGKILRTITFYVAEGEIDTWETGATVYVDAANGSDTNDGLTTATAAKTLKGAYAKLDAAMTGVTGAKSGKIVLLSDLDMPAKDWSLEGDVESYKTSTYAFSAPHTSFPVVLTGATGEEVLSAPGQINFNGETVLDNLTFKKTSTGETVYLNCKGYTFVATANLKCTSVNTYYMTICGGFKEFACRLNTDVQLHGGIWSAVYVGDVGTPNHGTAEFYMDGNTVINGTLARTYSAMHVVNVEKQIITQAYTGDTHMTIAGGTVGTLCTGNSARNIQSANLFLTVGAAAKIGSFVVTTDSGTMQGKVTTTVQAPTDGTTAVMATVLGDEIFVDAAEGSVAYTSEPTGTVTTNAKVKIGNRFFGNTVASALEAYQTGETVTLLADITEDVEIPESVTVDYNGFTITGTSSALPGDMNGDGEVTSDDAIYLLKHVFSEANYPIDASLNPDCNGSGEVTSDDAIYLLKHVFSPDNYPLS